MDKILFKDLSYKLVGVLFKVHNELGNKYQEKYYQRAIAIELKKQRIPKDFQQVLAYLQLHKLQLGILVNFRSERLIPRRVINL